MSTIIFLKFHRRNPLKSYGKCFLFQLKCPLLHSSVQVFKFSSLLPRVKLFQEKVENGIIMTSWNGLRELPIVIFGEKTKNTLNYGIKNGQLMDCKMKSFEHIWQLEKGLVISSWTILLLITNSIKQIKLDIEKIFDNFLSKYPISNRISWLRWPCF